MILNYQPLTAYLASQTANEVTLSFAELEHILGQSLPHAAYTQGWWSDRHFTGQRSPWVAAGWVIKERHVRLRTVTFMRRGRGC